MMEETCLLPHVRERNGEGETEKRGREVIRDVEREEGEGEEEEQ